MNAIPERGSATLARSEHAITLGNGKDRPQGRSHKLTGDPVKAIACAIAGHDAGAAWWSASTFDGHYRAGKKWRAASAIPLDLDYHDAAGKHATIPPEAAARAAAALGELPNLIHDTPRGLRAVFVLAEPATDAELFLRAARGAAARAAQALGDLIRAREGLTIDPTVTKDRARFLWTPGATVDGVKRSAEVRLARPIPWRVEDLAARDPEDSLKIAESRAKARPAPGTPTLSDRIKRASAYLSKISGAVSGEGGHAQTWSAALSIVRGFALTPDVAYDLLAREYNPKCSPPWTEKELHHKIEGAAKSNLAEGYLLDGRNGDPARPYAEARPATTTKADAIPARVAEIVETNAPKFPVAAVELAPIPLLNVLLLWDGKTEAPKQFILMASATYAGALLGRTVGTKYASGWLHPLFFTGLIAPTGLVKTTAERIAARSVIGDDDVDADAEALGLAIHSGMMGSGVGLVEALSEAGSRPLLWRIPELNTLMKQAARDGAGDLSSVLSALYDGRRYTHKRASKKGRADVVHVERPTVAIIATGQERGIRTHLDPEMVGVGTVNRFVFVCASAGDVEPVPFPEDVTADESGLRQVRAAISSVVGNWRSRAEKAKPEGNLVQPAPIGIPLDADARKWWEPYYLAHKKRLAESESEAVELTVREPEHVRKLALLRAALEMQETITTKDLLWGHAIASYSSACAIFCCDGAGGGETRRDTRANLFGRELHKAGGAWVRIRDFAHRRRNSIGDPEELRRIVENGAANGEWKFELVQGVRGPAAPAARCICAPCAEASAKGGGMGEA